MGDAFKDRFLFDEGHDKLLPGTGMAEAIIFHDIRTGPSSSARQDDKAAARPEGVVFLDGGSKVMQNPAGILGANSNIICRVFGRNLAEFRKTIDYLYMLSNTSKLKLLHTTVLGDILNLRNIKYEAREPHGSAATDAALEMKVKEIQEKYPQGMSEADIEKVVVSSLQERQEEFLGPPRQYLEAKYRENPEAFCENANKFDVDAIIRQMRIQAGWIPSDRPQPAHISDIVSRFHMAMVKEEVERLCRQQQQGDGPPRDD